jgi:hypothetical protein
LLESWADSPSLFVVSFANTGAIRFKVDKRRTEEGRRITASYFASNCVR